jgi:hypothetical protein
VLYYASSIAFYGSLGIILIQLSALGRRFRKRVKPYLKQTYIEKFGVDFEKPCLGTYNLTNEEFLVLKKPVQISHHCLLG